MPKPERITKAVHSLRLAVSDLKQSPEAEVVVPDFEEDDEPGTYALGIQPGVYRMSHIASAIEFLADMLEV